MASLVELEFAAVNHADALSNRLQDQLECDVRTLEEIWKKLEPLPTPPLSPERGRASPCAEEDEEYECYESDGVPEDPLLGELLQCEQLLAYEEEYLSGDSQNAQPDFQASLIIQDCLLSDSKTYEPRSSLSSTSGGSSTGVYTPSPSPSPPPTCPQSSDEISDPPSTDCISPTAVFPALVPSKAEKLLENVSRKERIQRRATTSCINTRVQPQAMASESDEEIDVVTVIERPKFPSKLNPHKRLVSVSAPCSRQTSPVPSPLKKRRYHTKRLQRLSSVGSNTTDGTESDDEQRRASHNVLERKRRNDLKYSFQVLRGQIPDLEENQRAPKVTILRKATDFIKQMQEHERHLEMEWQREKKRKERLMERLAYLRGLPTVCC